MCCIQTLIGFLVLRFELVKSFFGFGGPLLGLGDPAAQEGALPLRLTGFLLSLRDLPLQLMAGAV